MLFPTNNKSRQSPLLRLILIGGLASLGGFMFCVKADYLYEETPYKAVENSDEDARSRTLQSSSSLNANNLKQKFQVAKAKMIQKLKDDYGVERFEEFLMTDYGKSGTTQRVTQGRRFFVSPTTPRSAMETHENEGPSWGRFVNRLAMKIIRSQLLGGSNNDEKMPFIWASGGHSSAAAHGNYYNESYTATLERTGKEVFEAVGLDLIGRNYAMGGTGSGKEVGSCSHQIFGLDPDVVSWDYGMTDGRSYKNTEFYFYRASLSPSRPALFSFSAKYGRENALKKMEEIGLTTLFEFEGIYISMEKAMPNCEDITDAENEDLPPMVKDCKCEDGGSCTKAKWRKYGNPLCDKRKFQTSWHPGWKWHGLVGNLLALGLMEGLEDAVKLIESRGSDPEALLQELQQQQDADYKQFADGPIPNTEGFLQANRKDTSEPPTDIDLTTIYKGANICRTARTPAEARHLGIVTESDKVGFYDFDISPDPFFDMGISKFDAAKTPVDGLMPLTYDPVERQKCPYANIDYKDWFHVQGSFDGWSKLVVPNAREKQVYGPKENEPALKGYVAMCLKSCPWNKCPKNYVNSIEDNRSEMKVNGQAVKELTNFGDCKFLKGAQGHTWQPNANGQFEISFKVGAKDEFMQVSSIMIW